MGRSTWLDFNIYIYILYYLRMVYGSELIELLESGCVVVVESRWLTWVI